MPQPPNLNKMLEQAQAMLAQQQEAQEKLKSESVEATAGGGMVKVEMDGQKQLKSLKLERDVVNPDDLEMLQDLVMAAINEASRKVDEAVKDKLSALSGGLKIPGLT